MAKNNNGIRIESYVLSDHGHIQLLQLPQETAAALIQGAIKRHQLASRQLELGHTDDECHDQNNDVNLINKFAVEIAPDLWVYRHDGIYYLTAPRDSIKDNRTTIIKLS